MSLIEQLGGYERAVKMSKEWESSIDGGIPLDTMMYFYDFGIFSWGDLQYALLDYRRAHNIYEVGDWVIPIKQPESEFFHAVRIDRIGLHGGFYDTKWRLLNISKFRHATDAEIEAGRRL